jgi:hypothetical protein
MDWRSPPSYWISLEGSRDWKERGNEMKTREVNLPVLHRSTSPLPDEWWADLVHVQTLARGRWTKPYALHCYAQLLCQALEVPQDCKRLPLPDETHHLHIFANPRAVQVYCCHNPDERRAFEKLLGADAFFGVYRRHDLVYDINYEEFTRLAYLRAREYLVWEFILPEGIDMEALSPRDTNSHLRAKQPAQKSKPPVPKLAQKEKDHPPPPPAEVREPPSSDRTNGAIYYTGRCLGKGGFAICYEGQLAGTKQLYALKMVKSHMPMKKMEQKVLHLLISSL